MRSFILSLIALSALAIGAANSSHAGDCGGGHAAAPASEKSDIVATAIGAGSFNTLVAAVKEADLVSTLQGDGPFTVFAPSDEAFAKLPAGTVENLLADKEALKRVLTYHVVSGRVAAADVVNLDFAPTVQGQSARIQVRDGNVFVDDAKVVATDVEASNGIIHVIDTVLMPRKDIVDTAVSAGQFGTLVTAVKAAGLVETLKSKGPFTVFAPADSAFAALPAGTVEGLLQDKAALTAVLTYHVVSGRVLAENIAMGKSEVKTVQGQMLSIERHRDGTVMVGGAKVIGADVLAGNGVIHVIDGVLLPSQQ